jgi:menaquinone-dependent protoporphyrinogen oxidase
MSEDSKMTRRRFLALAGGAIGATAVACCGLTVAGTRQPEVDLVESSCGEESGMENGVLIAYASKYGSTAGVAEAIGEVLCASGTAADVRPIQEVTNVSGYAAAIVGSAVYMRRLIPQAVDFVKANQQALSQVPVAYFVVCGTLREDTQENRKSAAAYLDPVRQVVQPVDEGLFAGAMDHSKMSLAYQVVSRVMGGSESDWRDWSAIRGWAEGLTATMLDGER